MRVRVIEIPIRLDLFGPCFSVLYLSISPSFTFKRVSAIRALVAAAVGGPPVHRRLYVSLCPGPSQGGVRLGPHADPRSTRNVRGGRARRLPLISSGSYRGVARVGGRPREVVTQGVIGGAVGNGSLCQPWSSSSAPSPRHPPFRLLPWADLVFSLSLCLFWARCAVCAVFLPGPESDVRCTLATATDLRQTACLSFLFIPLSSSVLHGISSPPVESTASHGAPGPARRGGYLARFLADLETSWRVVEYRLDLPIYWP